MALLSFHSQNMVGTGYYLKYGCSFFVPFYGFVHFFVMFWCNFLNVFKNNQFEVIQIPHQNTQYISVVNQHGKVIGSQGGPPKLYIKNSSSSGKSGVTFSNANENQGTPHQVVLQQDGAQQLVIPSSMIPQQRLLVQTSTGNILPQGNKIYIQQANNINQPIILNQV